MRLAIVALLASFLTFGSAPAISQDAAGAALEGAWVVSVGTEPRDRFLIVRGARAVRGRVEVAEATYGWIDAKASPVKDWRAEISGDTITVSFVTPADSRVRFKVVASESSVAGEFARGGKTQELRLTRIEAEELAALRASLQRARQEAKAPAVTARSTLSLVYVGADDCPSCRHFIAKVGKDGKGLKDFGVDVASTRFVYVGLWGFRDQVTESALPPDMAWLIQPDASGRTPMRKRGTPLFLAVVDRSVIAQGHGTVSLEKLVVPALRRALELKNAAAK